MSPELAFLLTLALRMAITAAFVVTASVITERSGPVIGALVATLPIRLKVAAASDVEAIVGSAMPGVPLTSPSM